MQETRNDLVLTGLNGWITVKEASKLCGVTVQAIHARINAHRLQAAKVGQTVLVKLSDLRLTGRE